jgi:prolyl 4-hydroxylase
VANNCYYGVVNGQEASSSITPLVYEPFDDASWAIHSTKLSSTVLGGHVQRLYDDFIDKCDAAIGSASCVNEDQFRLRMNREQPSSVYNYTKLGYEKIKAPPELFAMILDFYKKNKHRAETEWKNVNTYHNMWEAPPTIVHLNRKYKHSGGGGNLQTKIWDIARPLMEQWTGQELAPVSLYGIRLYHNSSILAPHVDRMPLVTSAISKY